MNIFEKTGLIFDVEVPPVSKKRETITTLQSDDWGEQHTNLIQDYIELQDKYNIRTFVSSIGFGILTAIIAVLSYMLFIK